MNKVQVLLLVVAVLLVVVIYSLPKVVVNNESTEQAAFIDETIPGGIVDHSTEIPEEVQPRIAFWKDRLLSNGRIQPNIESLDSLMAVFMEINKYDSAAYYAALYAEELDQISLWQKAGDAYFEAFTFALDKPKIDFLGGKAREIYQKILEEQSDNYDVKHNVAMTYVSSSNPMQGIMMLREILEQDPDNQRTLMSMGRMSIQTSQFENAVERFETYVRYYPLDVEGNFFLGVCYYEIGQLVKAKAQFNKVKELGADEQIITAADEYLERIS